MDNKAFQKLSYGLYLISAGKGDKTAGCVVNTLAQATSSPQQLLVTINKDNYTTQVIQETGHFVGVALAQSAGMELIGEFGFKSSKDVDKFAGFETNVDESGTPYVCEQAAARFSCKVVNQMDAGSHIVFLAEVIEAQMISDCEPMTYSYYHTIKKGVTPPKASSYIAEPSKGKGYRCTVCGYVTDLDPLPDDFVCPICGQGRDKFVKITE